MSARAIARVPRAAARLAGAPARGLAAAAAAPPPEPESFAHVKRVAVIGAGVAGLSAARALAAQGFSTTIFEAAGEVGGVWRSNYDGFGAQVPRNLYEFPDLPMAEVPAWSYPTGAQVHAHTKAFFAKFVEGRAALRLHTRVAALRPRADGARGWLVDARDARDAGAAAAPAEAFDFVVISTGLYSRPFVPALPGAADFGGAVVHSTAFTDAAVARGKRVVVLGGAKSAADCALAAARAGAASTTLLSRAAHWATPRNIAGAIPFQFVFLSRFGQALVSWYKGALPNAAPPSVAAAHAVLAPIMRPIFGLVEALFAFQLGLRGPRAPKLDVVADFYGFAAVFDGALQAALDARAVVGERGAAVRLRPGAVKLADGRLLPCDLVVAATGFAKDHGALLPAETVAALGAADDGLYLYRHTLPAAAGAAARDLAFVGAEVASISNIATSALQAEWLARLLAGKLALPARARMADAVAAHAAWARSWMPQTASRAALVLLHQTHYHDALLKDMGERHRRKGNPLAELFMPYRPADYRGVCSGAPAS